MEVKPEELLGCKFNPQKYIVHMQDMKNIHKLLGMFGSVWCPRATCQKRLNLVEINYRRTENTPVVQPAQKVGKGVHSTAFNNYWLDKSAFFLNTKVATIVKEHSAEELRMSGQLGCINLETLTLNLWKDLVLIIKMD